MLKRKQAASLFQVACLVKGRYGEDLKYAQTALDDSLSRQC